MPRHSINPGLPHVERRRVPAWWWLVVIGFSLSLGVAFYWYLGPVVAAIATILAIGIVGWVLLAWPGGPVTVTEEAVTAGRNRLTWPWVGEVTALDRAAAHDLIGPDADPRAHLQIRPWLPEAVRIDLDDPADPHPYWVIGTRDATRLAAAMDRAREAAENTPEEA